MSPSSFLIAFSQTQEGGPCHMSDFKGKLATDLASKLTINMPERCFVSFLEPPVRLTGAHKGLEQVMKISLTIQAVFDKTKQPVRKDPLATQARCSDSEAWQFKRETSGQGNPAIVPWLSGTMTSD